MPDHQRSVLVVLADGAHAATFEALLAAGELPEIKRHLIDRGCYRRGTTTFASTTGPAHIPIMTGCFAGTGGVPGYRWFEREAYRPHLPTGPWCFRSYNGPEAFLFDRDMDPARPSIHELTRSVNIFGMAGRGAKRTPGSRVKSPLWTWAHYAHDYSTADRVAERLMLESLAEPDEFRFVAFPGIDWSGHYTGSVDAVHEAFRRVDRAIGRAATELRRRGTYDDTMIVVCSDHGHLDVATHFDVAVWLQDEEQLKVAYHSMKAMMRDPDAVSCVSGNGAAHLHFRGEDWRAPAPTRADIDLLHPGLRRRLLERDEIDLVVTRGDEPGTFLVERTPQGGTGMTGSAELRENDSVISYRPLDGDPLGLGEEAVELDTEEALRGSIGGTHPDAALQILQSFRTSRAGDVVISARPGYDLRERYERPEHLSSHGALHADHMLVPVACSEPLAEGPVRTADLFTTALDFLGRQAPVSDGTSRLAAERRLPAM